MTGTGGERCALGWLGGPLRRARYTGRRLAWGLLTFCFLSIPCVLRADIRFDVFIGYDGTIPRLGYFPVVCEVLNDGPTFEAVFELRSSSFGQGDVRQMNVELPTGTLKRFLLPVHSPTLYNSSFDARLYDSRGRVRAESLDIRVRAQDSTALPTLAAASRNLPVFPEMKEQRSTLRPRAARLQTQLFPDNPIALEGLSVLYLSSSRALELKPDQAEALRLWMYGGGHLVMGVEQASQVESLEWLAPLLPCRLNGATLVSEHRDLQQWLVSDRTIKGLPIEPQLHWLNQNQRSFSNPYASLAPDEAYEGKEMQVANVTLLRGRIIAGTPQRPYIVGAQRGLGRITVLTFNPELEPFDSWEHRDYFWAKVCNLPPDLLGNERVNFQSPYQNLDAVLAAMIETRQVRKLPVGWLLLLLVVYMVVIGPLDRYWLKKINRQMLTWLTFPAYVAFFSVLIYFIGYKLRAGETEWNELHMVDVLKLDAGTAWRGRTYGTIYSPANRRYEFASEGPFAALRSEFSNADPGRSTVRQVGNGFDAEVAVSVWTSRLLVEDWWRPGDAVVNASLEGSGEQVQVNLQSQLEQPCTDVKLVHQDRIYDLGRLEPGESKRIALADVKSERLTSFVDGQISAFQSAMNARRQAFGRAGWTMIQDMTNATMAASFVSVQTRQPFLTSPGFDLSDQLQQGDAVILAWTPNMSPGETPRKFNARRGSKDVLWRIPVPANSDPAR